MHTTRFLAGLAGMALLGLVACGQGDNPIGPDLSFDNPAAVSNAAAVSARVTTPPDPVSADEACPAGLERETKNGVTACVQETDFDVERCVTPDMLEGKTELLLKMGFLNESPLGLYNKPVLYHSPQATCGAIDENPGSADHAVTGFPIEAGNNGIATWTFELTDDMCGTYAFVDTVRNGETTLFEPMHYIINTGEDCPLTCQQVNPQLKKQELLVPAFAGPGIAVPLLIPVTFTGTWDVDGAVATLHKKDPGLPGHKTVTSTTSPFVHTFRYRPPAYFKGQTAHLEVTKDGLTCTASVAFGGGLTVRFDN